MAPRNRRQLKRRKRRVEVDLDSHAGVEGKSLETEGEEHDTGEKGRATAGSLRPLHMCPQRTSFSLRGLFCFQGVPRGL